MTLPGRLSPTPFHTFNAVKLFSLRIRVPAVAKLIGIGDELTSGSTEVIIGVCIVVTTQTTKNILVAVQRRARGKIFQLKP